MSASPENLPAPSPSPAPPLLGDYLRVVRQRWIVVAAAGLAGLLVGGGVLLLGTQETARTDLNLNVISADPFNAQRSAAGLLDGPTEVQIARSYAVADAAAKRLGDVTPDQLRDGTSAELVAQATVIRISFTASDAAVARERADAIAAAYLDYRADQAVERRKAVVDQVDARLDELRDSLTEVDARAAAAADGSSAANQAASDRQLITIEVDSLLSQRNSLQLIDTSGGSVLTSAGSNPISSAPSKPLVLATGLLAGLVIGLVAAFAAQRIDRRVRTADDVTRVTGAPTLARLVGRADGIPADGPDAELVRTAREQILARFPAALGSIAVVDDTVTGEASAVPINLGIALAQTGRPVRLLLPGADETRLERLRAELGLLLLSRDDTLSVWTPAELPELRLITTERTPRLGDPDPVLTRELLDEVARCRDDELVLLVLPAAAPLATRLAAARATGAVIGVVALGGTDRATLARDRAGFESLGAEIIGSVLVPGRRQPADRGDDAAPAPVEPHRVRRTEPPRAGSTAAPRPRRRRTRPPEETAGTPPELADALALRTPLPEG
ncbi:hypothetical protein [Schumannella soli]|uniref:Polysaccharide chain length determinant N-terminal domain-containing protein n=1 Tax=Schumannella soli TaxID=2590779 RepID=A0A506Y4A1_9MICO|nr:hypothetical protein [Schumannella soli]TPW76410.1 hypothetical protein FJ657_11605 [Schumannella soli]